MTDPLGLIGNIGSVGGTQRAGLSSPAGPDAANGPSFKKVLMDQISEVNRLQQDAEKAIEDLATGRRDDIAQVMLAKQKADTAFNMLLQVRNKLQDAYDEVKQIRV